jgi:hypothetical protein
MLRKISIENWISISAALVSVVAAICAAYIPLNYDKGKEGDRIKYSLRESIFDLSSCITSKHFAESSTSTCADKGVRKLFFSNGAEVNLNRDSVTALLRRETHNSLVLASVKKILSAEPESVIEFNNESEKVLRSINEDYEIFLNALTITRFNEIPERRIRLYEILGVVPDLLPLKSGSFHPIREKVRRRPGAIIAAPMETPILATIPGIVTFSGKDLATGNTVIIKSSRNEKISVLYSHLHERKVTTGELVKESQIIGTVGNSGRVTGPTFYHEWRIDGYAISPPQVTRSYVYLWCME